MIFDFDFKSFSVDDFDYDFKIILRLICNFKPSKSSFKSPDLASCITGSSTAVTTVAESTSSQLIAGLEGGDDYGYGEKNSSSSAVASSTSQVKAEAMNFLSDADKPLSLSRLDSFPAVKRLFLNFNTALPSSAPVERLFSIANQNQIKFIKNKRTIRPLTL